MGTSAAFGGPPGSSPLLPSWLQDPDIDVPVDLEPTATLGDGSVDDEPTAVIPTAPLRTNDDNRFTAPRTSVSEWAASSGTNGRAARRSLGRYARESLGGQDGGAKRLRRGREAAVRLASTLHDIQTRGINAVLLELGLGSFVGRGAEEIAAALSDAVCPMSSLVDDALVRDAFLDTITVLADEGIVDFESITDRQIERLLIVFTCNVIRARYLLDCARRAIERAPTDNGAGSLKSDIGAIIEDLVGARLDGTLSGGSSLGGEQLARAIESVYKQALGLLMRGENA